MAMFVDARVPVAFGSVADAAEDAALLVQGDGPVPAGRVAQRFQVADTGHAAGCACCAPRGPAAEALARLFLARVRGEVAPFSAVVVVAGTQAGANAVRDALSADPFAAARYRLAVLPLPRLGGRGPG